MNKYTIGEVAKLTGVPAKTLRFYEEKEIIKPALREENGYRLFSEENIEEIKVIRNARDLGLPLNDIKELLIGCKDGDCKHTKERNKAIVDNYVKLLTERIAQMQNLKKRMEWVQKTGPYCCGILHQLTNNTQKGGEK